MARIFPDAPVGSVSTETLRIYRLMKQLPDDWGIWHRLNLLAEPGPDFWVLLPDGRGLLLKVSLATPVEVRGAGQLGLFAGRATDAPGHAGGTALDRFRAALPTTGAVIVWRESLPGLVLFPNVAEQDLRVALTGQEGWGGKERLLPEAFQPWLDDRACPPLSEMAISAVRKAFAPEVVIPPQFTVRQSIERHTDAQLTDYLLDYGERCGRERKVAHRRLPGPNPASAVPGQVDPGPDTQSAAHP